MVSIASSWKLTAIEASGIPLTLGGASVTGEELVARTGTNFDFNAGANLLELKTAGDGVSLSLTINKSMTEILSGDVHLHLSNMACCIGDKCLMWPPPPPAAAAWSVDATGAGLTMSVNGDDKTSEEIKAMCGGDPVTIEVGNNYVICSDGGNGKVKLSINGSMTELLDSPAHLTLSRMACCIGDACVMWPAVVPLAKRAKKEPEQTDADFLLEMEKKLGEAAFKRMRTLLGTVAPAVEEEEEDDDDHQDGPVLHPKSQRAFDDIVKNNDKVLVDCSAVWCAPCKRIAPKFAELAEAKTGGLTYVGVDIQDLVGVQKKFQVGSLPCFLFLDKGVLKQRLVGDDLDALKKAIEEFGKGNVTEEKKEEETRANEYDLIVIGGGSGGMATAKKAAFHGASVAVFDYVKESTQNTRWGLGGTCVNVGCVPKKLMHYAALLGEGLHDAQQFGWKLDANNVKHNWRALVDNVQGHVRKLNFFYEKGLAKANTKSMRNGETVKISDGSVTYYNALAKFASPTEVAWTDDFGGNGTITGKNIVVAVGGRPWVPPEEDVPGARELAITSDDLFSHKKTPGKTLCVGAGYIALECGGFLANLGYDTTIAVRSVPLRSAGFDRQCVNKMVALMKKQGLKFTQGSPTKFEKKDGRIAVTIKDKAGNETIEVYDTVLYATGRGADTAGLNLDKAGVKYEKNGKIKVDEQDRTNVPHIFAIGDIIVGSPELTPYAIQVGELLASRLYNKSTATMDASLIPTTVFTPFEYGRVGLTEEQAVEQFGESDVELWVSEFESLEAGAAHRHDAGTDHDFGTNCLAKLVCVKSQDMKVVGFHFVGPNAGEITQGFALGVRLGAKKSDFDSLVGIHPTDAESFCSALVARSSGEEFESAGGCGGGKCG